MKILGIGVLLVALFAEWNAAHHWFGEATPWPFLGWHGLSVGFLLLAVIPVLLKTRQQNLALYVSSLWIFFPVFGVLPALFMVVRLRDGEVPAEETMEVLNELMQEETLFFKDLAFNVQAKKYVETTDHEKVMRGIVEPVADVLKSQDFEAKKKVISQLRAERTGPAIRLLKMAQKDPLYEFQYLATVALTAIEQDYIEEIQQLEREIEAAPKSLEPRIEIIRVYYSMISTGVVSGKITAVFLNQAEEQIQKAYELFPENPTLLLEMGKIDLVKGEYEKAKETLKQAILFDEDNAQYRFWYAQTLYYLDDHTGVRAQMEKLAESPSWSMDMMPYIEYWSQDVESNAEAS